MNSDLAYEAFIKKLAASPPTTKDEADAARLMADAFASLATVEKTRAEMQDAAAPETVKRRRLEHWINKFGIGTTLTGIAGTVFFLADAQVKNHQLKEQTAQVAEQKIKIAAIDERKNEAERKVDAAKQQEDLSKQKTEIAAILEKQAVESKKKALGDTESAVSAQKIAEAKAREAEIKESAAILSATKAEERRKESEERLKDRIAFSDADKTQAFALKGALVALPAKLKQDIAGHVGTESPIAKAIEVEKAPILNDTATKAEVLRLRPKVLDLFSADGTKRGIAYDVLTNGKDRAKSALVQALIEVTGEKTKEYIGYQEGGISAEEQAVVALLRRGLENVVVTLRDMSRSVTKRDTLNLQKLNILADSLMGIDYGVGDEAKKFKIWLNDGAN